MKHQFQGLILSSMADLERQDNVWFRNILVNLTNNQFDQIDHLNIKIILKELHKFSVHLWFLKVNPRSTI